LASAAGAVCAKAAPPKHKLKPNAREANSLFILIVVTHEMGFAREVADELVFMDDGVIVESGPPREVLGNPAHERTRAFLSKVM
jgi:ABC-type polar amino acid transport system ATPase subunit